MNQLIQPTPEVYSELQYAYDHFNRALFSGQLPDCLITLQRERRTYGYFSAKRFMRRSGEQTDEIAMNPSYFVVRSIYQSLSTLVHEQVHLWQEHFGNPSRKGYHNAEWANKMENIGLMPSNTGQPGGKRVGDQMTHYIIPGGAFDVACVELVTQDFQLSWIDRFAAERPRVTPNPSGSGKGYQDDDDEDDDDQAGGKGTEDPSIELGPLKGLVEFPPDDGQGKSNRVKYRCSECTNQVWGKPGLIVSCGGRIRQVNGEEVNQSHSLRQMQPAPAGKRQAD